MTNEEISKLSDVDLRMHLIELIHPNQQDEWYQSFIAANNGDYCNNWNDLMPLVVKYGVRFRQSIENGYYQGSALLVRVKNKNPKRALAECLLLVLLNRDEDNE